MQPTNARDWWEQFLQQVRQSGRAAPLKDASRNENLKEWTRLTTETVVRTCEAMGWETTALGHRVKRIPVSVSEYLKLDAMAFPSRQSADVPWPLPLAVFELENSRSDKRIAYSLWKLLCTRAPLRVVLAYRPDWDRTRDLIQSLSSQVVASLSPEDCQATNGETAVVTGSRGESETFPHGYFKLWLLDTNRKTFDRI